MTISDHKIKFSSLSDWAYHVLSTAIFRGEQELGSPLKESHLAEALNISRSPIREAIKQLVHEGMAEMKPHKGAVVIDFSHDDIVKLMRVRQAMESLLVAEVCSSITSEQIDFCRKSLLQILEKTDQKTIRFVQDFYDFHDYLLSVVKNQFLVQPYKFIANKIKILRFRSDLYEKRVKDSTKEHLDILDAIATKDVDLAEALMKSHIASATEIILSTFNSKP